jgi:hypothetical protein
MTRKHLSALGGLIMLIGLTVIFIIDVGFWPWILVVVAFAGVPTAAAAGRLVPGIQSAVWLGSFAALIAWEAWWPWILVPIGVSTILTGVLRRSP